MNIDLFDKAKKIIINNDLGNYTVPTRGLYPFQWNWDSCLTALGFAHFDEARAWVEIETLFNFQWEDGMVPHIIFHKEDEGYFPGPNVWGTGRKTSGITQPPVAGFAINRLYEISKDKDQAKKNAIKLIHKIHKWHQWFYQNRDPLKTCLVAIIHPWESGRDNSIDWDKAFEKVPTDGVIPFERRDTKHANPNHRPTEEQYKRYIWLLQLFKSLNYDNSKLHEASPFKVVDPGFNAILIRSCFDLSNLAKTLGETEIAKSSKEMAVLGSNALETLWSEKYNQYLSYDRNTNEVIDSLSIGGLLPIFTNLPEDRINKIQNKISNLIKESRFVIASHDKNDERFEPLRYWRGPVWLIMNYMISNGLKNSGNNDLSDMIIENSLKLIKENGFAEYYSPIDGTPCGGDSFTWTAAMIIEFIKN
jgi:glycogen debranching enzyme